MADDRWLPVPGYEGHYEVSESGLVKSLARTVRRKKGAYRVSEKLLSPASLRTGHKMVRLCNGGNCRNEWVHRLVAKAFIQEVEGKPWINHKDGDPTNNHFSNLEWCTASENAKHSYLIGREVLVGERKGTSKLTADQVLEIRARYAAGTSGCALAREYGMNQGTISDILNRKLWRHLP